jgi:hypothetical protein
MGFARVLTAASGCVLLGAAIAACSGSFGSGSNSPIPLGSLGPSGPATPTPPATSSSVVLTYGDSDAFQNLPIVGGYSGAIAFPKAPPPTAPPSAKPGKGGASPAPAPTALSIAIGATLFITKPDEGPDLNFVSGKGKGRKARQHPARALAYIKLLPTHDITLEAYPRIAIDIPRELASEYRDGEFGLALWNSGDKDTHYRLAVAERDATTSPPPIGSATMAPIPTVPPSGASSGTVLVTASPGSSVAPTASPSAAPQGRLAFGGGGRRGSGAPAPNGSPGVAPAQASATLPPQQLLFAGTATTIHLLANRPAIFAIYALPNPAATAAPSPAASRAAAAMRKADPSAAPSAAASAASSPAASSAPATSAPSAASSPAPAHS